MLLGVLLAGGQSTRMGQDKALLNYQGVSLLEKAHQLLIDLKCDQILISRNDSCDTVKNSQYIEDIYRNKGPLAGIHACLKHIDIDDYDEAIILPVDMPLLQAQTLHTLLKLGRDQQTTACYLNEYFLPFYVSVNSTLLELVEQHLTQDKLSIKQLHRALSSKSISYSNTEQLINTNTSEQWSQVVNISY
jgi:molybdenum cofactor guanylyltransferase